jgi:MFS family permease
MLSFLHVRDTASPWMLYVFVILFGCGSGSTGPIIAAAKPDLFPGDSMGRIMGTFTIGFGFGGAMGPYLAGYFYDRIGSYTPLSPRDCHDQSGDSRNLDGSPGSPANRLFDRRLRLMSSVRLN